MTLQEFRMLALSFTNMKVVHDLGNERFSLGGAPIATIGSPITDWPLSGYRQRTKPNWSRPRPRSFRRRRRRADRVCAVRPAYAFPRQIRPTCGKL